MTLPGVTVAVCTLDRAGLLAQCLESLLAQSYPRDRHRILVIDNGSRDGTPAVAEAFRRRADHVDYLHEPALGLSRARNRALSACATPYIAFIDDDATANPDWLEKLMTPFAAMTPAPAVVGGEIEPLWETPRPDWVSDGIARYYSVLLRWDRSGRPLREKEWVAECNVAVECAALRAVGGFPVSLGRRGSQLLSGEGLALDLIRRQDRTAYFEPTATVTHRVAAERLTMAWLQRRIFWGGVTASLTERELRRRGHAVDPPDIDLPMDPARWREILGEAPTVDGLDARIHQLHGLGYVCERLGWLAA